METARDTAKVITERSLAIGIIHNGTTRYEYMNSIATFRDVDNNLKKVYSGFGVAEGPHHEDNRNAVVRMFLSYGAPLEWLLWVDTDEAFNAAMVYALLDAADPGTTPIISGMVMTRPGKDGRLQPNWFDFNDAGEFTTVETIQPSGQVVQRLAAAGAGFMLVHRSAFEAIPEIPVELPSGAKGVDPWRWYARDLGTVNGEIARLSEDLTFCARANTAGLPIYGHLHVNPPHFKIRAETVETWLQEMVWNGEVDLAVARGAIQGPGEAPSGIVTATEADLKRIVNSNGNVLPFIKPR